MFHFLGNRRLLGVFTLLFVPIPVRSDENYDWSSVEGPNSWVVVAADDSFNHLYAATINGGIYTATSSKGPWQQSSAPINEPWSGIAVNSHGQYACACSSSGAIYCSVDYGGIWNLASGLPTSSTPWTSVAVDTTGKHWVVTSGGGEGLIYQSDDYGTIWHRLLNAPAEYWRSIVYANGTSLLLAAAYGGGIYSSTNNGLSFTQTDAPESDWVSIASDTTGRYLCAAVYLGGLYTSKNGGSSWSLSLGAPQTAEWASVATDATGEYMTGAVGSANVTKGYIYVSQTHGVNWKQSQAPKTNWMDIAFSADAQFILGAAFDDGVYVGTLLLTDDDDFYGRNNDAYYDDEDNNRGAISDNATAAIIIATSIVAAMFSVGVYVLCQQHSKAEAEGGFRDTTASVGTSLSPSLSAALVGTGEEDDPVRQIDFLRPSGVATQADVEIIVNGAATEPMTASSGILEIRQSQVELPRGTRYNQHRISEAVTLSPIQDSLNESDSEL